MKKTLLLFFILISVLSYSQTPVSPYFFYNQSDIPALQAKMTQAPFAAAYSSLENGTGLKYALEGNAADAQQIKDHSYNFVLNARSEMYTGNTCLGCFGWARLLIIHLCPLERVINTYNFTAQEKNNLKQSCDSIAWRFRDVSYIGSLEGHSAGDIEILVGTAFTGAFMFPDHPNASNHYTYASTKINEWLNAKVGTDNAAALTARYTHWSVIKYLTLFSKVERNYLGNNSGLISNPKYRSLLNSYLEMLTPKNTIDNNLIGPPGVGDTTWGENLCSLLSDAAAEMKLIDIDLAKKLQKAWMDSGSVFDGYLSSHPNTLINCDPTIIPNSNYIYPSKIFNKLGFYVFRNQADFPNQSYLISVLSPYYEHSDVDCGSFSLFANNTPLLLDSGSGGYNNIDVPYFNSSQMHNIVSFEEINGNPINGLEFGPTEVDSYLSTNYDYWRANLTPPIYASKYYRNLAFLKNFSNTVVVYDYIESNYNSNNNLHVFSTDTDITTIDGYPKSKSHCYNNMDVIVDFLSPKTSNTITIQKSRLDATSSWPNNLADANANKYQQWLTNESSGDTQYLTIIRPQSSTDLETKTYQLISSNVDISLYKVKELNTNNYFVLAVNKSKSTSNQTVNFNASIDLKDIRTNSIYQPNNGSISLSVPFASFVILIPLTPPTQDTGSGIAATNPSNPVNLTPDVNTVQGQFADRVGINTISPHASSKLEIKSTRQGFLPPRLSNPQMQAIANPAEGLIVFCTDCPIKSLYIFDGQRWLLEGSAFPKNIGLPVATTSNSNFSVGSTINLNATAGLWSGIPNPVISYQWQQSGVNISGATNSTLTTIAANNATYRCTITATNSAGATSISTNTIAVNTALPICTQPPVIILQNSLASIATFPTFTNAQGTIIYQWLLNSSVINGANDITFTILPKHYGGTLSLRVSVYNNMGTISVSSNLIVVPKILDVIQSASVAFSLRKLSSTYSGNAIKVRRSSDNTTQDIGFAVDGQLDVTALTTFVGAGDGFVDTWYDQSGNGRDVVNVTLTAQPKIVSSGVVNTQNGKPAVLFTTTSQLLSVANATWLHNTPQTFFSVTKDLIGNGSIAGTEYNGNGNYLGLGIPNGFMKVQFFFNDGAWGVNQAIPNSLITTLLFTAPGSSGYINGIFVGSSTGPSGTGLTNAKKYIVGQSVSMSLNEIIHYNSALPTSNRMVIESNLREYYGINF